MQKTILLFASSILLTMLISLGVLILIKNNDANLQKKLNAALVDLGRDFYAAYFYPEKTMGKTEAEIATTLENYADNGLLVNLDSLSRYNHGQNEATISLFVKSGEGCNKENTSVILYPLRPYGKSDVGVKTNLDCGFETQAKD